jgi:hypothetical protein
MQVHHKICVAAIPVFIFSYHQLLGTDGGFKILNVQRGSVPCVHWLYLSVPQDKGTCDAAGVPWDRTGGGSQAHYRTYICFTHLVALLSSAAPAQAIAAHGMVDAAALDVTTATRVVRGHAGWC